MSDVDMTDGRVDPLTDFDRKATIPIIVCAVMSAVATSTLLTYLAINSFLMWRRSKQEHENLDCPRRKIRMKFKNQGYFWLVNLFMADLVQAVGWALSAYPLSVNRLWPGFACSVQGFFINVGDVASSIWALVIALHTFLLLAGGQRARAWASEKSTMGKGRWIFCSGVWAAICFLGLIGPLVIEPVSGKGPFYNGAGGGWCWIGHNYPYERIFFHYFFVFLDMIALTVLYCLVFIYIRIQIKRFPSVGTTSTHPTQQSSAHELERWHADLEALPPPSRGLPPDAITTIRIVSITTTDRRPSILPALLSSRTPSAPSESHFARKRMLQVARSLLWYPLIYLCLTTPITIGRLGTFAGDSWGQTLIFVGAALYSCAGWCNVLLYTATRKGIISWTWCGWKRKVHIPRPKSPFHRTPAHPPLISGSKESESSTSRSSSLNPSPVLEPPPIPPPKDKSDYFGLGRIFTGDRTPEPPPPLPNREKYYLQRNMEERDRL